LKQKHFAFVLSQFSLDPNKAKAALTDKRLTAMEKIIVECYFLHRDKKNTEVISLLNKTSLDAPDFVLAQRNLILGLSYCNIDRYYDSELHLMDALAYFKKEGLTYFEFVTRSNLFILYLNSGADLNMQKILKDIQNLPLEEPRVLVRRMLLEFFYYNFIKDFDSAETVLNKISGMRDCLTDSDYPPFLTNKFDFFVKREDFEKAALVLEEMKDFRKYNMKENFSYCKYLLEHVLKNSPIYFYEKTFDNHPTLFNQLKVIQKLEERNFSEATLFWRKLQTMHPHLYLDNFVYKGEKSLFSVCLGKHVSQCLQIDKKLPTIEGDHLEKLAKFFHETKEPIPKDDLYLLVWGERPTSKADYVRLSNTIGRLRKKYGLVIKSRKGCYYLESSEWTKAS
jgi:tetratricopeptide (TPR) repeat protein